MLYYLSCVLYFVVVGNSIFLTDTVILDPGTMGRGTLYRLDHYYKCFVVVSGCGKPCHITWDRRYRL